MMYSIAWHSTYAHELPLKHRFPMEKYNLLPQQLLHEGTIEKYQLFEPAYAKDEWILAVHETIYFNRLKRLELSEKEIRKTGFPHTKELIDREILIAGGTVECCHHALKDGIAFNIAGGTHHAFKDRGEGFCLLNDQAIAAQYLLERQLAKNILIIDLDVHQGNGTASIFKGNDQVYTFSMHGEKNYPMQKEPSNCDVSLPDGICDNEYLHLLQSNLDQISEKFVPDFIFYLAGVDVLSTDKLGRLNLSIEGCKQRDIKVLNFAVALRAPTVVCMGGGYSDKIVHIVEAHANTFRVANDIFLL